VMALGKEGVPAAVDLQSGVVNAGPRNPFSVRALRIPRLARPLGEALVAAARELGGPGSGRALGAVVDLFSRAPSPRGTLTVFPGRAAPVAVTPVDDWPPPVIAPVVKPELAGE